MYLFFEIKWFLCAAYKTFLEISFLQTYKSKNIPRGLQPVYINVNKLRGSGNNFAIALLFFTRYHDNTYELLCFYFVNVQYWKN